MRRIALLADIHANRVALEYVLEDIKKEKVQEMIFLGDLVAKGIDPSGTLQLLQTYKPLSSVKGNTDAWFEEINQDWQPQGEREVYIKKLFDYMKGKMTNRQVDDLKNLPRIEYLTIEGFHIACTHASPQSFSKGIFEKLSQEEMEERLQGIEADLLLVGHTHCPMSFQYRHMMIMNPGAVGTWDMKGNLSATYGILSLEKKSSTCHLDIHRVPYPAEELLDLAHEMNYPELDRYRQQLEKKKK